MVNMLRCRTDGIFWEDICNCSNIRLGWNGKPVQTSYNLLHLLCKLWLIFKDGSYRIDFIYGKSWLVWSEGMVDVFTWEIGKGCEGVHKCLLAHMNWFMTIIVSDTSEINPQKVTDLPIEFNINFWLEEIFKFFFNPPGLREINDIIYIYTHVDQWLVRIQFALKETWWRWMWIETNFFE